MPTFQQTAISIYGAYRLARLDGGGMAYFDTSVAGFWRSFFAAALVAPFYALLLALRSPVIAADADPTRFVVVEVIAYVISWVAYPLVVAALTRRLGCWHRYVGYIVAYNWAVVLQIGVVLAVAVVVAGGVLPEDAGRFFSLVVYLLILGYLWFIARTALAVPAMTAAGIVVVDVALSYVIDHVASRLY